MNTIFVSLTAMSSPQTILVYKLPRLDFGSCKKPCGDLTPLIRRRLRARSPRSTFPRDIMSVCVDCYLMWHFSRSTQS
jgi:hypothetical protein